MYHSGDEFEAMPDLNLKSHVGRGLTAKLASDFSKKTRQKGTAYYQMRRVEIMRGDHKQVDAIVSGSNDYAVALKWEPKEKTLHARCECAYFEGGQTCKHLWAVILAADAANHLLDTSLQLDLVAEYDFGFEYDSFDDVVPVERPSPATQAPPVAPPPPPPKIPEWQTQLTGLAHVHHLVESSRLHWPPGREILYVVNIDQSRSSQRVVLSHVVRDRRSDGTWKYLYTNPVKRDQIVQLPSAEDREILSVISASVPYYGYGGERLAEACYLPEGLTEKIISMAARAGRCCVALDYSRENYSFLTWDEGEPWQVRMELRRKGSTTWEAATLFRRGEDRISLSDATLITDAGLVFTRERVFRIGQEAPLNCLLHLKSLGSIRAPANELHSFLNALLTLPGLPPLEVPEELRYEEVTLRGRPCLHISAKQNGQDKSEKLQAKLSFDYEGRQVREHDAARGFYDTEKRRLLRRDAAAEKAAAQLLSDLSIPYKKAEYWNPEPYWQIAPGKLPRVVRALVEAGWHIEAEGKVFRRPGAFNIEVTSGIDWFELHGEVEYGEAKAQIPELLEAVRRGESMVRLGDGTYGVLPEQWLQRIGMLAGLGTPEESHIRFRTNQAGLLDALLASQPEATCDETFARVRSELGGFQGIEPAAQPAGFVGTLRQYQREGLGWMEFLRRFSFGGCLADDMGVGKTAQVLGLLERRRELRAAGEPTAPSLVVAPRSLVFNWKEEAARFTPQLRVLDYTGSARDISTLSDYDLVLTTYGTLRRDVVRLKDVEFDYIVLDEAQAIKNANTDSAKAARLLRGNQRLALSGTPVENHLGELWSLFEFLNPGMLGRASVFKLTGSAGRNPSEDTRQLLSHALRPFILRRTKAQVAPELPPKTEQTIYCELKPTQRKLYDELRRHYRDSLLQRVQTEGLAKSKIQVLEALLRLRQAACHPALIDPNRSGEKSAKLESLLEQLREVLDEGHKALVFSQFTSLLALVRDRLDQDGTVYEYLDGATVDRQAPVERFQNSPECKLFLISLKAGGLGLNLTAAEYVFLLDPWWNPAVEAQAIDRAHRIGQTQQVFAYRLIARDTVEEKVLELQKTKRDLADAIISADNSLIGNLRREELELLLS